MLVAHGFPPELLGGTEKNVEGLAHGLLRRGHEVVVVAGSMQWQDGFRVSHDEHQGIRVVRIHRADPFFDHWQKSHAHDVGAEFSKLLESERPDVVHVHHWIRLSDDLVLRAARAGIPACVTLHDLWTSCLVTFRVRPETQAFCEEPLAASPCLGCASHVPPKTPWIDVLGQTTALFERKAALVREITTARGVIAPTVAHARALGRFLGLGEDQVSLRVIPHGRDLQPADLGVVEGRPTRRADAPGLVLGSWGHLHPLKGPDLLIDAVRLAGEGIQLHLAGGAVIPTFFDELQERARGLDVHFHPAFDVGELGRLPVTAVDAFVSGSRAHESWGLVVDEAAALGLPMVLPNKGAFPERLDPARDPVRFYEAGSAEDLARVLVELRDGGLPAEALELARLVPDLDRHTDAVEALYAEIRGLGAPRVEPEDWFEAELAKRRRDAWDESLASRSGDELGFDA